jgi:hypothetical protein
MAEEPARRVSRGDSTGDGTELRASTRSELVATLVPAVTTVRTAGAWADVRTHPHTRTHTGLAVRPAHLEQVALSTRELCTPRRRRNGGQHAATHAPGSREMSPESWRLSRWDAASVADGGKCRETTSVTSSDSGTARNSAATSFSCHATAGAGWVGGWGCGVRYGRLQAGKSRGGRWGPPPTAHSHTASAPTNLTAGGQRVAVDRDNRVIQPKLAG